MKKLSAILLIFLFAFSQYARQLSYLECKFSNTFKPDAVKCDCEKKAGFDKPGTGEPSAPNIHTHIHLDEFFSIDKGLILSSSFNIPGLAHPLFSSGDECAGIRPEPWQPPNT